MPVFDWMPPKQATQTKTVSHKLPHQPADPASPTQPLQTTPPPSKKEREHKESNQLTRAPLRNRRIVDIIPRHHRPIRPNPQRHARQASRARKRIPALLRVIPRPLDLPIIRHDQRLRHQQQRGARVRDRVDGRRHEGRAADRIPARGELPEAVGGVDGHVGDGPGVFGRVDEAEVVAAGRAFHQVGGEERGGEGGERVGKEGLLLRGRHRVDGVEGQAEEAVRVVLFELRADGVGELDGLVGYRGGADADGVGVHVAGCAAAVAVGDVPGFADEQFGSAGGGGVVERVAGVFGGGEFGGENPARVD